MACLIQMTKVNGWHTIINLDKQKHSGNWSTISLKQKMRLRNQLLRRKSKKLTVVSTTTKITEPQSNNVLENLKRTRQIQWKHPKSDAYGSRVGIHITRLLLDQKKVLTSSIKVYHKVYPQPHSVGFARACTI